MHISLNEVKTAYSSFIHFDSGSKKLFADCFIERSKTGLINQTYFLTHKPSGEKYVVRKLNSIFDWRSINNNLKLLEAAQRISNINVPEYWHPVEYLNVYPRSEKLYTDRQGSGWVVMKFISGKIETFDNFGQVPVKVRYGVAHSFGEALKIFQNILSGVPLKSWQQTLPNFHDVKYHYDYLHKILNNERLTLSLSRDMSRKVSLQKKFLIKYKRRINNLLSEIEKRKNLAIDLEMSDLGVVHGDPKINNAIFSKDNLGNWQCICLIDLDTIQVEPFLNDLGDALRSSGGVAGEQPESLDLIRVDKQVVQGIIGGYTDETKRIDGIEKAKNVKKFALRSYTNFLFMLGMRFLVDSLVGNQYFRLKEGEPEDLNLYRAEVQFKTLDIVNL